MATKVPLCDKYDFFSGFLEMMYVNSVTHSDLDHCFDTDLILHL